MVRTVLLAAMSIGSSAMANTVFLASQGTTLYRFTESGTVKSFTMSDTIIGMAVDANGVVYATSNVVGTPPGSELYRLDNPGSANPTLTLLNGNLSRLYTSITFINGKLYGVQNFDNFLTEIDLGTFAETPVGATGSMGTPDVRFGGLGFDAAGGKLYGVESQSAKDGVYDIDWSLSNGPDPTATLIGAQGFNNESAGAEWVNGKLYAVINNVDTGDFEFGTINTGSGAFTASKVLGTSDFANTGLTAIPAPGVSGILALGGLAMLRRRR